MGCNYCFGCGTDLAEDAKVCPSCGKRLDKLVNPPPLKVSEESRQAFKRNIPAPVKVQPKPAVIKTEPAPVKQVYTRVPPSKGAVLGYGFIVLNSLAGVGSYFYDAVDSFMGPFQDPDLPKILGLALVFLCFAAFGVKKLIPRKLGSGQELVKKKTSVILKILGVIFALPALIFGVVFVSYLTESAVDSFKKHIFWHFFMLTSTAFGLFIIAGLGIRQFFPKMVIRDKPPEPEVQPGQTEQPEPSAAAEKIGLVK